MSPKQETRWKRKKKKLRKNDLVRRMSPKQETRWKRKKRKLEKNDRVRRVSPKQETRWKRKKRKLRKNDLSGAGGGRGAAPPACLHEKG
jgi:hypothetical protein